MSGQEGITPYNINTMSIQCQYNVNTISIQYQYNINTMSIQCRVTSDEKWQLGDY